MPQEKKYYEDDDEEENFSSNKQLWHCHTNKCNTK